MRLKLTWAMPGIRVLATVLLPCSWKCITHSNTHGVLRINSFYGIRYAKPPVHNLRWQKPIAIDSEPWSANRSVTDATEAGPRCIAIDPPPWVQGTVASNNTLPDESEDCLLLNVLVPKRPTSSRLPVLVNIHGGGYVSGTPPAGDAFVHQAQGEVIFVAIQYRLGVFGFLAGEAIQASGAANAGLLDQRAALEWVRRNIHHFGGDPDKVTIMGGSAGGGSVTMQMMLHGGTEANPPFRAAIPEYAWWAPIYNQTWVEKQYRRVLEESDCADLICLRRAPTGALNAAAWRAWSTALGASETIYGLFYFGPAIDGDSILGLPTDEFRAGNFSAVPVLVDRDMHEGPYFTPLTVYTEEDLLTALKALWQTVSDSTIKSILELYPPSVYNSSLVASTDWFDALAPGFDASAAWVQMQAIFGASIVDCPSTTIVQSVIDAGQRAWKMVFEAGIQLHGATMPYLWSEDIDFSGTSTLGNTIFPGNATLARALRDYVASFVIHLDPNVLTSTTQQQFWPEFSNESRQILHMKDNRIGTAYDFDSTEQCALLSELNTFQKS
ncbi:lipase 2 [Colletotrichum liriopes]|uniref:Carboxylic ester hydrolase n=1 Tax=Colletotrichum liriopes TaxID=708192 RepID=A0AA37LVD0_9PEZI|nr:lipase 2 [Colletotrichum liriopes]